MPAVPPPTSHPTWKQAWDAALYGAEGFFRREAPAAHFRTSVHASPLFARALVRMTREAGLDTVVDIGAGRGELLAAMHALDPGLDLLGVEVAARPAGLDPAIAWTTALPESVEGLVVANEWLDNIPCHVVEVDADGVLRVVHVDPATGEETPRPAARRTRRCRRRSAAWVRALVAARRAASRAPAPRSARTRDAAWADVVGPGDARASRWPSTTGTPRDDRPPFGSLRSYRDGHEVDVLPDGSRDVTAHVAVDAVADRGRRRRTPAAGRAARARRHRRAGPTWTWRRATRPATSRALGERDRGGRADRGRRARRLLVGRRPVRD